VEDSNWIHGDNKKKVSNLDFGNQFKELSTISQQTKANNQIRLQNLRLDTL
jgi:hypothetical protein